MPDRFARSLLIGMALLSGDTTPSSGQEYPTQPVKIIVPFVAGGGVDVVARIVAPKLSDELGQSVIIENRGGAGGVLGAAAVAQAPPDGYTLLFGTGSTHGTNPSIYPRLSYDPVRDFVPIVLVSSSPLLLVSATSVHARSVKDLIDLAHARRDELSYASYGIGSINHLAAELFNAMAEIQANHVPYRGSAPALTDLIAGRISYMFDGVSTSLGYIEAGTMRVLGVAGPRRTPVLPDVPTISDAAIPGFDTTVWFGLFAPAGTSRAAVDKINGKMNAVLAAPDVRRSFDQLGIEPVGGPAGILVERVKSEIQKWAGVVREKNIRLEQ